MEDSPCRPSQAMPPGTPNDRGNIWRSFMPIPRLTGAHQPRPTCSGSSQSPRRVFTRCCWAWNAGGSFAALRDSPAVSKCSFLQRAFRSCNNRPVPIGQNYCAEVLGAVPLQGWGESSESTTTCSTLPLSALPDCHKAPPSSHWLLPGTSSTVLHQLSPAVRLAAQTPLQPRLRLAQQLPPAPPCAQSEVKASYPPLDVITRSHTHYPCRNRFQRLLSHPACCSPWWARLSGA